MQVGSGVLRAFDSLAVSSQNLVPTQSHSTPSKRLIHPEDSRAHDPQFVSTNAKTSFYFSHFGSIRFSCHSLRHRIRLHSPTERFWSLNFSVDSVNSVLRGFVRFGAQRATVSIPGITI